MITHGTVVLVCKEQNLMLFMEDSEMSLDVN